MGKNGKRKTTGYVHNHSYNPKAHESHERKLESIKNLTLKRYQSYVNKILDKMKCYLSIEQLNKKKLDPSFHLRGAARVAQQYYYPTDYIEDIEPVNLLEEYHGKMWEHEEGKLLLKAMLDLGISSHNISNRTKDAIKIFIEMIDLDPFDHLHARYRLLRCYLDLGDGLHARELLDMMYAGKARNISVENNNSHNSHMKESTISSQLVVPISSTYNKIKNNNVVVKLNINSDKSSCCLYNRAFIEHISLILEEKDSSSDIRNEKLLIAYKENPYVIWMIIHYEIFKEVMNHTSILCDPKHNIEITPGTIEDAICFYEEDIPLWLQTENVLEWLLLFVKDNNIKIPNIEEIEDKMNNISSNEDNESNLITIPESEHVLTRIELYIMYKDMIVTGFEIIHDKIN